MKLANREEAGRQLAQKLREYVGRKDVVVLGIPRGGVPVAFQIAFGLGVPLDIFLSRKLGVPGHEELAFGAIAAEDGRYLDESIIKEVGISASEIEEITRREKKLLDVRAILYRRDRPPLDVSGQIVILVDDGIATGASVFAAIHALRQMKPAMIVLAVPVMPAATREWLQGKVDRLVCLHAPEDFRSVGEFYQEFGQVDDQTVITLLQSARKTLSKSDSPQNRTVHVVEVSIDLATIRLAGTLSIPADPIGLVMFAHGSGRSRHSPRNRYVAEVMQSRGLATLLFDLLTGDEERIDQQTSQYRFDIRLLAKRLIETTLWARRGTSVRDLPVGYFGASTGAAAALIAAAELPNQVAAVVSRGGRPDLAGEYLSRVEAAVLLIVGGKDDTVLRLNQEALQKLRCTDKQLVVIPQATHLFEEAGTLENAAHQAADWFGRTLARFPLDAPLTAVQMGTGR